MASLITNATNFVEQLKETRKKIGNCFQRCHEALRVRESTLLSRVDEIEREYNSKTLEMRELLESLNSIKAISTDKLKSNKVKETNEAILSTIDSKIAELTADTDSNIEFEWDTLLETSIEQLGSIKLNCQTKKPPLVSFPPDVKPVVPDYKAKQLPTAYCCKSSQQRAPGEMNDPRCIAVHYATGNIYIADFGNHRMQVLSCKGEYLFTFNENMNRPFGICITNDRVLVTQYDGCCVNAYELDGKLIKSVGSKGRGDAQFGNLLGLAVSDRTHNVYICDCPNHRVQIFTEDLKFLSMLWVVSLHHPVDVKVTWDRVLVLAHENPCMFVFDSNHILINRLITWGAGKQTNHPSSFDIDRDYNIIMSDFHNHCVYVFSQEGEEIHRIGKKGQGIGDFYYPWGVALDNTGRIVVVCQKKKGCLQFF